MKRKYKIIGERLKDLIYIKAEENSPAEVAKILDSEGI